VLYLGRYLSGPLRVSRFNRSLHKLRDWLLLTLETLGAVFAHGAAFLIDSMPVPVCCRARARRCRPLRDKDSYDYCAAKCGKFFGRRRHLIGTTAGVPTAFDASPRLGGRAWPSGRGRRVGDRAGRVRR